MKNTVIRMIPNNLLCPNNLKYATNKPLTAPMTPPNSSQNKIARAKLSVAIYMAQAKVPAIPAKKPIERSISPQIMIMPCAKAQIVTILTCFEIFVRFEAVKKLLDKVEQIATIPIKINTNKYFLKFGFILSFITICFYW
ncbi:MAG TPA: hypothetical protein VIK78_21700 [Ruminiclostridium sp.]